jgi:hypothetical protein
MSDFNCEFEDRSLPRWFWMLLAVAGIYVLGSCFFWGVRDGMSQQRERILAARFEAMKQPMKYSLPEHLLDYDKFVENNKVEGN